MSFDMVGFRRFAMGLALVGQLLGSVAVPVHVAQADEFALDASYAKFYRLAFATQADDLLQAGFAEVALQANVVTEDCSGFAGCEYTVLFVHTFERGDQMVSIMATVFYHPLLAPEVRSFELPRV